MDQNYLNNYFGNVWRHLTFNDLSLPQFSGLALVDKVRPDETVIDIGCGSNNFKPHIPNLVGIDPAFPEADYQLTLEDFIKQNDKTFDVAFCLGSINFGNKEYIAKQIEMVTSLVKDRIYWRTNPGLKDHGTEECKYIDFYAWTFDDHIEFSEQFGFKVVELRWDTGNRIYAEWKRR